MTRQPNLFDVAPLTEPDAPRARRTDPKTSHEAADSMTASAAEHRAQILRALESATVPLSAEQIAARAHLTHVQVNRRMAEMRKLGLVVIAEDITTTATGRSAQTYLARPR